MFMDIQMAGIRNIEDAIMCAECGVSIIGLLVGQAHTSDDFISKELARDIKNALPNNIKTTLITHLEKADEIIEIADFIDVDYIQLHSHLPESEVKIIREALPFKKLLRLIHIGSDGKILNDIDSIEYADFYFTDSINLETNQVGGTGLTHNLETDKKLVESLGKPVFIAGGLTPENVAEAVKTCKPFGVDVNSGCRGADGNRDKNKVLAFVKNARNANKEIKE
jgi:phosphoribosylanthranilate isomerase